MNNLVPIPRSWKIQSSQRAIPVEYFSDEEIVRMFEYVKGRIDPKKKRSKNFKRYLLLLHVLLFTGARIDEALAIRPRDVHLDLNTIDIITLKRKKPTMRSIPLHRDLKDALMTYFLEFHIDITSQEDLFPMIRQAVNSFMKRMERDLGFRIYPHKFRHTFGVKAIINHVPLSVLQLWMGHASIFNTSIYVQVTGMDTSQFMNQMPGISF